MDSEQVSERDFCVCPVNTYPRDSPGPNLVFTATESQMPCVISSVSLGSLLQRVLMFTYFTLEVLAMFPLCITPVLTSSHFSVLSLQLASWWEDRKKKEKEKENPLRTASEFATLHTTDTAGTEPGKMRTVACIQNSPHILSFSQKKVKFQKTPCKSFYCWGIFKGLNKISLL